MNIITDIFGYWISLVKKNENTMFYIHMIWYIFLFEEIGTPESADTESKHLKKKVTESRKKMNQKCFLNLKKQNESEI